MLPPTTPPLTLLDPPTVRKVYDNPPFVIASPFRLRLTALLARVRRTEKPATCQCHRVVARSS